MIKFDNHKVPDNDNHLGLLAKKLNSKSCNLYYLMLIKIWIFIDFNKKLRFRITKTSKFYLK